MWHQRMDPAIRALFEVKSDEVVLKENPKLSCALARTARREQPEAFQGQHSDNLLFIVDEASGVDDIIFETGQGSMSTPGAKTVMTSNPTRTSGYFYESHHRMRRFWATMKVSCEESSRVSPSYIEEMAEKWGKDSNIYKVRVLGEFPSTEDDAVIPLELVEAAVGRDVEEVGGAIVWGLDVARFGDDASALAKRRSNVVLEPVRTWKGKDLMQTTGIVVREYEDALEKPAFIYVDSIGMGAGVVDRLCELGLPAVGVNVSESAAVGDRYMRLRDELWFTVKEWLAQRDSRLPKDEGLLGELTSPKYNFTSSGKLKVEGKDQMKARGVQSPNKADALCLTFAGGFKVLTYENQPMEPEWFPDL